MTTAFLLIWAFAAGFFAKTAAQIAYGLWLMWRGDVPFKQQASHAKQAEARKQAEAKALQDARVRFVHIHEQTQTIEMARKIALKGIQKIDAVRSTTESQS